MNIKKKFYKLLIFDNIDESKNFILDIINLLKFYDDNIFYDDIYIDNINLIFNNNLCICNIAYINEPNWKSYCNFIINDYYKINIIYYRLIIYRFSDLIYYIEKNGNCDEFNDIIKNINEYTYYTDFIIKNRDSINSIDKLNKKISDFMLCKDSFNNGYKKFCNKFRIPKINYINDDDFSYNNIINLYEDLITNKILDSNKKINELNLNNNNENQYYNDNEKLYFLDLNSCDIYYDKENKLLFNYKTVKGYRILYLQIIYSLILLKTKPKKYLSINFINKFDIDINNFKYVIGIIKNNENDNDNDINDINDNDNDINDIDFKINIGTICLFLNKLNIEYYVDFV